MKRVGKIFDKICTMENFQLAYKRATKGKKEYKEVKEIEKDVEGCLTQLLDELKTHKYQTSEYFIFKLFTGGKEREIYKLPMRDRIIQHALMNYMEPIFRKSFIVDTFSSIKGRGIHRGLYRVRRALKDVENTEYCLKLDIRKFYPSIDQELMKQSLRRKFKDKELLIELDKIVDSTDKGLPIGNYTSQYFANFFLTPFDHWVKETLGVRYYFRYCDDIVILGQSKEYLRNILHKVQEGIKQYKLEFKPNWQIFPVEDRSVDFLGYKIRHDYTLIRKGIKKNFKRKVARRPSNLQEILGSY